MCLLDQIGYTIMGNAAGSIEVPQGKEGKTASAPPGSAGSQKQSAGLKLPVPPEEELEERFSAVLVSCDVHSSFRTHVNFHTQVSSSQTMQRNQEFGICWKCARSQDKLIAVPGTQCHCGKIHKRSFIRGLTAALGSLYALLGLFTVQ